MDTLHSTPPSAREKQILDYQTQQLKLLPLIAATYAFTQAGLYMLRLHMQCKAEIAEGDFKSLPEVGTPSPWQGLRYLQLRTLVH